MEFADHCDELWGRELPRPYPAFETWRKEADSYVEVDRFTLQRAAGHANISTTRKYVHPTPRAMADAFQNKVQSEQRDHRAARRKQSGRKPERVVVVAPIPDSSLAGLVQ